MLVLRRARVRQWALCALALGLVAVALFGVQRARQAMMAGPAPGALAGRVVLLDPGHGGEDPGAIGHSGLQEKEVTLAVALKLRDLLAGAGATVLLTRSADCDLSGPQDTDLASRYRHDLEARMLQAVTSGAHVLISVHANSFPSPVWRGAQVFYSPRGGAASRRLALILQEEMARNTRTDREASSRIKQYLLERAPVPAATVEMGFLSNPQEEMLLGQADYQQTLAWAVFAGLARFFASALPVILQPSPSSSPRRPGPGLHQTLAGAAN